MIQKGSLCHIVSFLFRMHKELQKHFNGVSEWLPDYEEIIRQDFCHY